MLTDSSTWSTLPLLVGFLLLGPVVLSGTAHASECPTFEDRGKRVADLEDEAITESSGLAASRTMPGLFWTHNDSGGEAQLFLFDTKGTDRGTLRLSDVKPTDWEDMAIGACPRSPEVEETDSTPCVYVADIGDNDAERDTVSIQRFREPTLDTSSNSAVEHTVEEIVSYRFRYEDGPRDAEALLAHPKTGHLYVVSKDRDQGVSGIYRVPNPTVGLDEDDVLEAERIGAFDYSDASFFGKLATAGDIAPSGDHLSIRTYSRVYTYCVTGESFESVFEASPKMATPLPTAQGESIAYGRDGETLWLTSERRPTPLIRLGTKKGAPTPTKQDEQFKETESSSQTSAPNSKNSTGPLDRGCRHPDQSPRQSLIIAALLALAGWIARRLLS
jgi:hypothetical protein